MRHASYFVGLKGDVSIFDVRCCGEQRVSVGWFVCLGFFILLENFSLILRRHHYHWRLLTYALHLWPLSSEGSLAFHTYFDTGHPFIIVISKDQWHSHLLPSIWQWSCQYLFLRLGSVTAGIQTPNLLFAERTL